jgi:hypothetical protein
VLVFYLGQILLPNPTDMALLHSDWVLSKSWWAPRTTAAAACFWLLAIGGSLACLKRHPVILFGVGWYLIGHLLESSFVPLDLLYEHRNYLPSIGILVLGGFALRTLVGRHPAAGGLVAGGIIAILCAMTTYRSWQWSEPFTLALTEARHNPTSARARYEYGRRHYQLFLTEGRPDLLATTRQELRAAIEYGDEDFNPLVALINTYIAAHEPVPEDLVRAYEQELRQGLLNDRRLEGIYVAIKCQIKKSCPRTPGIVFRAVSAALANPRLTPKLKAKMLEWLAIYYANGLGDVAAARTVMEDAVATQPDTWSYRLRLLEVQVLQHDRSAATQELKRLEPVVTPWMRLAEPALTTRYDAMRKKLKRHPAADVDGH